MNPDQRPASGIPENNPSKAMDSKREVEQSPDPKTDQDFPGYPHYPAKENVMDQNSGAHRTDANLENAGTGPNSTGVSQRYTDGFDTDAGNNLQRQNTEERGGTDALDNRNDERGVPQNVSNEELKNADDIPGTQLNEAGDPQG